MTEVQIDEAALESMQSLLGEQFKDTLEFCCSEFERLGNEVIATIGNDKEAAIRHAHSLKSNAAQFGATSLSDVARDIELNLNQDNLAQAVTASTDLLAQVTGSQAQLRAWVESN